MIEERRANDLARRVFTLDEPWRSRFIETIAVRAPNARQRPEEQPATPTERDLAQWLLDRSLSRQVTTMLSAWTQER